MTETFLFLDTETTGFKKSGQLIQAGQGRVCQIAMILADGTGKTITEFQSLIKPNNWDLNGKERNYYGISYADCEKYGAKQSTVMDLYSELKDGVTNIVAHNVNFDKGLMAVEEAYRGLECNIYDQWYCTMTSNTHISYNGKWPKLDATLKHYTGKELIDAHDAMADTRACRDIFFAMRGIQL